MSDEVKRLTDDDWDLLLPEKSITLGKTLYPIKPMGLEVLASVVADVKTIQSDLKEAGVTLENYSDIDRLVFMTSAILENVPQALQKASGLHIEDLKRLPLNIVVKVLGTVLDINIESHEGLEKNLLDLAEKINKVTDTGLGMSSNSSSGQATSGKKSKSTRLAK